MSTDERPAPEPSEAASPTEPLYSTEPPAAKVEARQDRWASLREPARSHPLAAALGAAGIGLVVGVFGGLLINAHPMMSLTVGTAPYAPESGAYGAPPPPPPPRGALDGERGIGPAAPPPPPPPGERGPGGPPPPSPGIGPGPRQQGEGPPPGPAPVAPGDSGRSPSGPGQPPPPPQRSPESAPAQGSDPDAGRADQPALPPPLPAEQPNPPRA